MVFRDYHLAQLPRREHLIAPPSSGVFYWLESAAIFKAVNHPRALARKAKNEAPGKTAIETADQVQYCVQELTNFKTPFQIRQQLSERWGLPERTADRRIQAARELIKRDANMADRQEIVATMMAQCLKIATEASEMRQLSNAIGAMRLYGELIGVSGNGRN